MGNKRISVGLFCRVLPQYRLAVYEQLAKRPEIDLTVFYSKEPSYYSLKTVDPDGRFKSELIEMRAWRFGKQELLYQPDASRLIKSGRFDVVILSGNPRLLSNFPALWTARRKRVGVVWWSLGIMANQSSSTLAIRRWLMRLPEAILVYTQGERDYFVSKGLPAEKTFVAQNTMGVSDVLRQEAQWSQMSLAEFKAGQRLQGRKVILYCARLKQWKRLDMLIHSLKELLTSDRNFHLVVIGAGPEEPAFKKLAGEVLMSHSITWLGPIYDQDELAPWFLSADVLVVPEALGLTVFHAFAYGLPIITCDSFDHQGPESVALRHEYNGLRYRRGSVEDLTACINRICTDEHLRSRLSANAKRTVYEEYTVDKMVDGFVQAILHAYAKAHETSHNTVASTTS